MSIIAYVGLGSNIGDSRKTIRAAIDAISQFPNTTMHKASSCYKTKPEEFLEQADFINAVVEIETGLSPQALLKNLADLERMHHRVRDIRFGPRTLDCDILLYGDCVVDEPGLSIPHPRMLTRLFVLAPLYEIAPNLVIQNKALEHYLTLAKRKNHESSICTIA